MKRLINMCNNAKATFTGLNPYKSIVCSNNNETGLVYMHAVGEADENNDGDNNGVITRGGDVSNSGDNSGNENASRDPKKESKSMNHGAIFVVVSAVAGFLVHYFVLNKKKKKKKRLGNEPASNSENDETNDESNPNIP